MTDYKELHVSVEPFDEAACDLLAAFLADEGYESFVTDESGLTAYIDAKLYDEEAVERVLSGFPMEVTLKSEAQLVKGRDWNEDWEKNYFKPIVIADKCVIHSTFHKDVPVAVYDIVIDPKMAFGTGHHATTSLILEYLLEMSEDGLTVTDVGTGTGILAILCAMRGARQVNAIEIDEGAWENARENMILNGCSDINVLLGDAAMLEETAPANLLIANINRNIILADFDAYAAAVAPGGWMLLSGFYEEDVPLIAARAERCGFSVAGQRVRDRWCALELRKD